MFRTAFLFVINPDTIFRKLKRKRDPLSPQALREVYHALEVIDHCYANGGERLLADEQFNGLLQPDAPSDEPRRVERTVRNLTEHLGIDMGL